jgi:hypothetical protein
MRTSLLSHRKKAVQWSRRRSNGGPDQNIVLASFRYFDTTRFDDVMSLKTPVYVDIAPVITPTLIVRSDGWALEYAFLAGWILIPSSRVYFHTHHQKKATRALYGPTSGNHIVGGGGGHGSGRPKFRIPRSLKYRCRGKDASLPLHASLFTRR